MDATEGWTWYWGAGSQPEVYHHASSREDAIEQAKVAAEDGEHSEMTVCEGKPWKLNDDIFDADDVLEQWHDKNEECQDEDGELAMEPTANQKAELERALNQALAWWRLSHKLGRAYPLDTRNSEVISVPLTTSP